MYHCSTHQTQVAEILDVQPAAATSKLKTQVTLLFLSITQTYFHKDLISSDFWDHFYYKSICLFAKCLFNLIIPVPVTQSWKISKTRIQHEGLG